MPNDNDSNSNRGNGKANGVWTDLIDEFMAYTIHSPSPEIYRLWSAISMVSGAMERRVWTVTGNDVNYANLYVLLVGAPGTGKGIIREVGALWRETQEPSGGNAFTISSDSTSRAALVDQLAKADKTRISKFGQTYIYHSLLVPTEEFEVLLPHYDSEFISFINRLWNNESSHSEDRRHGPAKHIEIANPFLHILGGVQPAWFVSHFPEEAWLTGLVRRLIMVYAETTPKRNPFEVTPHRAEIKEHILQRLGHISALQGQVPWRQDAVDQAVEWLESGMQPEPTHTKLEHYKASRWQYLIKLAMTSAVSRSGELGPIVKEDILRALHWLFEVESKMEDIFRSMMGKSDGAVIEELHNFVYMYWSRNGKEGVPDSLLNKFLMPRVTSDKISKIIGTAERSNLIVKVPGSDRWLPRPKDPIQYH